MKTKGIVYLLLSAFSFSIATIFAKLVTSNSEIIATEITLFRFLLGFILISIFMLYNKKSLKPNNKKFLFYRAFFNVIAVILFFIGIEHTTITKSNLLNMTYPIFVFLMAPYINKEKTTPIYYLYLLLSMVGLYFIVIKDFSSFLQTGVNIGDMSALASGLVAAIAISSLREARKYDDSYLILFYLMGFGTIVNGLIVIPTFVLPRGLILFYISCAAIVSVLGQLFITVGYKYIDAAAGSIVSASRILFALLLGVTIFSDPLSFKIIVGIILLIISLLGVSGFLNRFKRKV